MYPIDPITLVNQVIQALTPLLPFLTGVSTDIGNAIAAKIGEDIYDQGKKQGKHLYEVIKHRFEREKVTDYGSSQRSLQNFAYEPEKYKDVFKATLLPLLRADTAFSDELHSFLNTSSALIQIIHAEENATVSDNEQTNTLGYGSQSIIGKGTARVERNKQNIHLE